MPRRPGSIDVNQINFQESVSQDVTFANSASFGNNVAISGSLAINQSAAAGSQVFVTTEGKVGIGTSAPAYKLSVGGSMEVGQYIYHKGDNNTWINFTDNRIRFNAGGVNFIDCQDPGSAPHKVRINNGGNNIDFIIKDNNNNVYFTADASTARVGIGTQTPATVLHLSGALTIQEKSSDPSDPAEGSSVLWMSSGDGTGDEGDIMMKITAGGVTKTVTLVDFSAS